LRGARRSDTLLPVTAQEKLLQKILAAASDANIQFAALCALLTALGFQERIRGSHHIFTRDGVEEILNLQPRGPKAKPYQVKQVREVIVRYGLAGGSDE
jgi:HicA toxin of bacterial toxin-antitoxin,